MGTFFTYGGNHTTNASQLVESEDVMLGRLNQATRAIKPVGQARMAHHGPPPTYTGLEAQIRAKLPNDHDVQPR